MSFPKVISSTPKDDCSREYWQEDDNPFEVQSTGNVPADISRVTHEMNNVLSAIMMATDLLKGHVGCRDCQEMLEIIAKSSRRGADIVQQVLILARTVKDGVSEQANSTLTEIEPGLG